MTDRIDRETAKKERGLLEQDYATPCPKCGGVVFEWWGSDTCRNCEDSNEETSTEQTTLINDGGEVEDGTDRSECTDKACTGEAKYALWMGDQFSRVLDAHESMSYDDGDLHPHVCETCLPRYENLHGDKGEFVRPSEKLATDGGTERRDAAGTLHTTYVSAVGSSVHPDDEDLVIAVIRKDYDFLDRVVDRHIPALGPPVGLLQSFKRVEESAEKDGEPDATRIAWDTVNFRDRYLDYVDTAASQSVEAIQKTIEAGRDVWLVCLEKEDTFCHRRLLAARIRAETPAHWRDLHEPVEIEEVDSDPQRSLANFGGGAD